MMTYGMEIRLDEPRPLKSYSNDARNLCLSLDPRPDFREALSIYRQMRTGLVVASCNFAANNDSGFRVG